MEANNAVYGRSVASNQMPVPGSPFERLIMAVDDLQQLQNFAASLADRIAGGVPQDAGQKGMGVVGGGGLIDGLERQTATILGVVSTIRADLQRIENRL